MRQGGLLVVPAMLLAAASPTNAAETVTYTYDALGRLTSVAHSGGDNAGMTQSFSYDAAGNRTQYQVTGSKNRGLSAGIIVLPLNGFTIIPLGPTAQ